MKKKLMIVKNISIWKTLRFNAHYFGWKGIWYPVVFIARRVRLDKLEGVVKVAGKSRIGLIKIGFPVVDIFDYKYERTIWANGGEVIFEGKAFLGQGSRISNQGKIILQDNVRINANSVLVCYKEIEIKKNTLISWDVLIMDTDFHRIYDNTHDRAELNSPKKILIGEHCWIGCRCLLLKGITIADNVIIAANSTVTRSIYNSNAIYGSGGKCLKESICWREESTGEL